MCGLRYVGKSFSIVPIELDAHPLSHRDQIHAPIAIEIDPDRIGNHSPGMSQLRRDFLGDVGEVATVVAQ